MDVGLKILLRTFWGGDGWKSGCGITPGDFAVAKEQGYMFDYPKSESHDEVLQRAKQLVSSIDKLDAAHAFLYSLSTRQLQYRSALGSYYYIKSIPLHAQKDRHGGKSHCEICNWYGFKEKPDGYELAHGVNVFNFERYKWGGVRHDGLTYALFDMEQFLKLPKVMPTNQDAQILRLMIEAAKSMAPKAKAGKLIAKILSEKILPANKAELSVLLGILGICDVFNSSGAKGYLHSFTDTYGRSPTEHTNDHKYPLCRWRAADGINAAALYEVFGRYYCGS
jgi:hypothetical protein